MIEISTKLQPGFSEFARDLADITEDIARDLTETLPIEIQTLFLYAPHTGVRYGDHQASAKGESPAVDTGELFDSLDDFTFANGVGTISLAEHAFYLDPNFGGGGSRPFIDEAIENSLEKVLQRL